jgi:hypothetical protein
MHKTISTLGFLCLAAVLLASQFACSAGGKNSGQKLSLEISLQDLCRESGGRQFSMRTVEDDIYILLPDRDTLALKLLVLSSENRYRLTDDAVYYLERISYTPEVDACFGEHLYLAGKDKQDIFFYDLQSETEKVLKHISRAPNDPAWWIDIIDVDGRLTAALDRDAGMDLFVNAGDALIHLPAAAGTPSTTVMAPFRAGESAHVISGAAEAGFTVYDQISGQLYRIRRQGRIFDKDYSVQALISGGQVHYAALREGELLDILVFNPDSSELLLYEEDSAGGFSETAVTLCRGATSVYFFTVNGERVFVYNEVTLDRKRNTIYRLSLLYPDGIKKYEKKVLYEDGKPIQRFQAAFLEKCLYVSFVQESLKMLSACFTGLGSIEDEDL